MKFAVKAWSNGGARVGVLQLGSCSNQIETPSLLLSTRKGLPIFIPPDLLSSLPSPDSSLFQVSPLHLWVHYSSVNQYLLVLFLIILATNNNGRVELVRSCCFACHVLVEMPQRRLCLVVKPVVCVACYIFVSVCMCL